MANRTMNRTCGTRPSSFSAFSNRGTHFDQKFARRIGVHDRFKVGLRQLFLPQRSFMNSEQRVKLGNWEFSGTLFPFFLVHIRLSLPTLVTIARYLTGPRCAKETRYTALASTRAVSPWGTSGATARSAILCLICWVRSTSSSFS